MASETSQQLLKELNDLLNSIPTLDSFDSAKASVRVLDIHNTLETLPEIYNDDEKVVTYDVSLKTKMAIIDKLLEFYHKHECYCGDAIMQNDEPQTCAPELLADIADNYFRFNVKWKDIPNEP